MSLQCYSASIIRYVKCYAISLANMNNVEMFGLIRWIYCQKSVLLIRQSFNSNTVILRKTTLIFWVFCFPYAPPTSVMVGFDS